MKLLYFIAILDGDEILVNEFKDRKSFLHFVKACRGHKIDILCVWTEVVS